MKLGFIILAHDQPAAIRRLTDMLTTDGDRVIISFDRNAAKADQEAVRAIADEKPEQIRVASKIHCQWGDWTLVKAVLIALEEFARMPEPPDYVHLMSAAEFPIRPVTQLKEFLRRNSSFDFIECCDISVRQWVRSGLSKERFLYYFPFNFKTHRKAFDLLVRWQRKYKVRRRMPLGLAPHMGSQWWTLRWSTCDKLLKFIATHPKVPRFFKTTWIPDESFFQTIIARIIPKKEIANLQLMFHHLTPAGRPYIFYNDHLAVLQRLPHFFIRKISPEATLLRENLNQRDCHRSRIPSRQLLAKVRAFITKRIDDNHLFTTSVSGHPYTWHGPELQAEKRPLIVVFLTDASQIHDLEELISLRPAYCWMGRPYAPNAIAMPEDILASLGVDRASWKLRDYFRQQFLYYLVSKSPETRVPIIAVSAAEDVPDLEALKLLEKSLFLLVKTRSLKSLITLPKFLSQTHAANSQFLARMICLDLEQLPRILDEEAPAFFEPPEPPLPPTLESNSVIPVTDIKGRPRPAGAILAQSEPLQEAAKE